MADKELEQQNRTLKELVDNQKETNKTLVTGFSALQKSGTEDSTFMSKNLGSLMEVAATMKAQKKAEQFDKREEVTEVDEKVEKLTEENVKEGKKSRNLLRTIAETTTSGYNKANIAASKATEMAREGAQRLRKLGSTIVKGVSKVFRETWGNMTKVAKRLTFGGLLFAAFMVAFMNFLGSDLFEKGFKILKEQIIPGIGKVWEILKSIGGHIKDFFGPLYKDLMAYFESNEYGSGQKSLGQIFTDNLLASLVGIAGLALLLAPSLLFKGLWVGGKWLVLGTLVGGVKLLLNSLKALGVGVGAVALGTPGAATTAGQAAKSAQSQVRKGTRIGGATFAGGQWVGQNNQVLGATQQRRLTTRAHLQRATLPPGLKERLGMARGMAGRLGSFAAPFLLALSGYDAWNVFTNDSISPADKKKQLGSILFGTVGTLGMMMVGGGIGALVGGPLGGIVGSILGGMAGQKAGEMFAGWLLGTPTGAGGGKEFSAAGEFDDIKTAKSQARITGYDFSSYALKDWEAGASWNMGGMPLGKAKTYTSPTKEEMIRKAIINAVTPDFHTDTPMKGSFGIAKSQKQAIDIWMTPVIDPLKETVINLKDAVKEWIKELGEQQKNYKEFMESPEYIKAYNAARSGVNLNVTNHTSNSGNKNTQIVAKSIVQQSPILRVVTTKSTGWLAGLRF